MSSHHDQHFVPQFYLRHFSPDRKRLNLINIKRQMVVKGASLRDQCARKKFYDFGPRVEHALGAIESKVAPIVKSIIERGVLPPQRSTDDESLITFIVLQIVRGLRSATSNDDMTDYLWKLQFGEEAKANGIDVSQFRIENEFPTAIPLKQIPHLVPHAQRLRPHLFANTSGCGFVTSDDPVVLHNQYCEGITYCGVLGWQSRGLQVFYPLSPTVLLMLYDPAIYKVGGRRNQFSSSLSNTDDITHLNALQILNSVDNIYFADADEAATLLELTKKISPNRPKRRVTFVESESDPMPDGSTESLIHFYPALLRWCLNVSKIKFRKGTTSVPLHQRAKLHAWKQGRVPQNDDLVRYAVRKAWDAYDD